MHQHGNGHGSNTARHRGEIPSSVGNLHISLATTSKPTKHNKCKCIQGDLLQRRTYIIVVHIAHKSLPRFLRRVRDWVYAWRGSVRKLPRINSIRMKVYIFCLYDIKVALEGETLPQSMTTAPGFTQLLLTIWGLVGRDIIWELKENDVIRVVHISIGTLWGNLPTATTKMSAVRHTEAKSAVLTCANKSSWIVDWHSHNQYSEYTFRVSQ